MDRAALNTVRQTQPSMIAITSPHGRISTFNLRTVWNYS
jgi:hypothetical protein